MKLAFAPSDFFYRRIKYVLFCCFASSLVDNGLCFCLNTALQQFMVDKIKELRMEMKSTEVEIFSLCLFHYINWHFPLSIFCPQGSLDNFWFWVSSPHTPPTTYPQVTSRLPRFSELETWAVQIFIFSIFVFTKNFVTCTTGCASSY